MHQPRLAGGRMPLGAPSGIGGRGAGTRVPTPPPPAPRDPQGSRHPGLPAGRRSVPGGSPPPPRPLRSRGGSGPAREAGPGAPAGTRRRPALGRGRRPTPATLPRVRQAGEPWDRRRAPHQVSFGRGGRCLSRPDAGRRLRAVGGFLSIYARSCRERATAAGHREGPASLLRIWWLRRL